MSQAPASHWQYPREVVLNVAIEHRLMHAETLAYMLHQLPRSGRLRRQAIAPCIPRDPGLPIAARMVDIPAGTATLGIPRGREVVWLGQRV